LDRLRGRGRQFAGHPLDLQTQLALLVFQLPAQFRKLFEALRGPARLTPGDERDDERRARNEPRESHLQFRKGPQGTALK
jgi:hypothetical protein